MLRRKDPKAIPHRPLAGIVLVDNTQEWLTAGQPSEQSAVAILNSTLASAVHAAFSGFADTFRPGAGDVQMAQKGAHVCLNLTGITANIFGCS